MLTDDYIMRMINQMVAVLAKLIGFKNAGQYQAAQQIIDESLEQLLGLKPQLLKNMDDSSILNLLTSQGELGTEQTHLLAELYRHQADILMDQNKEQEALLDYQRALNFYLRVAASTQDDAKDADLNQKISDLLIELGEVNLPVEVLYQLLDVLERWEDSALLGKVSAKIDSR